MAKPGKDQLVQALLDRHGRTYAQELGIHVDKNTPSPLFEWLVASLLFARRISADLAMRAARDVFAAGWTTAPHMADSTWRQRVTVLNHAGYARYDESTARYLGDTVQLLLDQYHGDLRQLREAADHQPTRERELLKDFKGIGDTGVDIFFREVQTAWDELQPFADTKALDAAKTLGLGGDAKSLAKLVGKDDFPRLLSALVRTDLADDYDGVRGNV